MKKKKPISKKQGRQIPIESFFPIKPGVRFSDILMDDKQIMQEVYITRRTLQYYRDSQKISHTKVFGKFLYPREEIAMLIEQNMDGMYAALSG